MLARFATALLLLLGLAWAAPPLAAQDTVPAPELAALPLDSLFARMTSNDVKAQRAAFLEAVRRGSPEEIARYLPARNDSLAFSAMAVLLRMREPGTRVLLDALHAASERRQRQLLYILGSTMVEEQAVRPLAAALLRDVDEDIRAAGANLLVRPRSSGRDTAADPESEALVLAALADPSAEVRAAAAYALYGAGHLYPSEVRALIGILARDPTPYVRATAAIALGSLGHDRAHAVPALIAAMADPDKDVRRRSASALGHLGPAAADAVPVLAQATRGTDKDLRHDAVEALGYIGIDPPVRAEPVLRALEDALAHEDSTTRWMAVGSLAQLDARAVPLLLRALRLPDELVASEAAEALGRRPPTPPVIDALFAALRHPGPDAGAAAAEALGGFGAAQLPRLREAARAGSQRAAWAVHYAEQAERLAIGGTCYAFRCGPWQPPMELGHDSVVSTPPTQVRFRTLISWIARKDRAEPGDAWFVAEHAGPSAEPQWGVGTWRPAPEGEALELVWSNLHGGVALDLRVEDGGTMRGTARTFWDFARERQTAEVTGDRIPCPADPDAE